MTHSSHTSTERLDEIEKRSNSQKRAAILVRDYVATGGQAYEIIMADHILKDAHSDAPVLVAALRDAITKCDRLGAIAAGREGDDFDAGVYAATREVLKAIDAALAEARP